MLRKYFPSTNEGASLYKGFMMHSNCFCKIFDLKETFEESLIDINNFLDENGYERVNTSEFDETQRYKNEPVTISPHGCQDQLVLYIDRDSTALPQVKFIENEIIKFRDDRDWAQFHNSKDLSLAISIEANELLEQFLWKKPEDAKVDKIKEELADILIYAILLAGKNELDIEQIILGKLKKNNDKYPVEKAKGNAKKYDEL